METAQSFHLSETIDTVELALSHVEGQNIVCWEDIEQVFPGVKRVRNGYSVIKFCRSSDQSVNCCPHAVVNVVMSTAVKPLGKTSSSIDHADRLTDLTVTPAHAPAARFQQVVTRASRKARESEIEQRFISLLAPEVQDTVRNSSDIYQAFTKAIKDGNGGLSRADLKQELDGPFRKLEAMMEAKNSKLQEEMSAMWKEMNAKEEKANQLQKQVLENQKEMMQLQEASDAKQEEVKQLALDHYEEIKRLQIQALGQLAVLQTHVQAVLTQTYELHEYPIPRLFVVLPQDPTRWYAADPFSNKFRLYFLCECGEHTKSIDSNTEIHFAKHEGYEIARPTEFFQLYGSHVFTILKMLKFGISVAGVAVPAISHLVRADVIDQASTCLQLLKDLEAVMIPVIDWMGEVAANEGELVDEFDRQMRNKEALAGADLRKLDTFVRTKDGGKVLGNLYRTVTDEGHVKWVCVDHYREHYQESTAKDFQRTLDAVGGSFDKNLGRVEVTLRSRVLAERFFSALGKARSVYELDIVFDCSFTTSDLENLEVALKKSRVAVLQLNLLQFQTSKLVSTSSQYEVLFRFREVPSMRTVHIILPQEYAKRLSFQPKAASHPCKLSFELATGRIGRKEFGRLAVILKTNSTVTSLNLDNNSIGDDGAKALAEALKTNNTVTTLDLNGNKIGSDGAKALAEALKTNNTVTTLDLKGNKIGSDGAKTLAEALKYNSILTTLYMQYNWIGPDGAKALAEALKTNKNVTTLDLTGNIIGSDGAKALAEALKSNSVLTTLCMLCNSVGSDGIKELAEALKTNSILTTLDLQGYAIGDKEAQALAEALKINSMLSTLILRSHSITDKGALALAEALKINKTVTTLDLQGYMM